MMKVNKSWNFLLYETSKSIPYTLQTHPLVREGAPRRRAKQLSGKRKKKKKKNNLVMGPKGVPDSKTDRLKDRRSHQLNSSPYINQQLFNVGLENYGSS
jgi:hypothetical protein